MTAGESAQSTELVWVRRHWNDYRVGQVALSSMRDFHFRDTSGGVGAQSPRPMLYARILCNSLVKGEIAHSCEHGPPPHDVLVCVVQRDNSRPLYKRLVALIDAPKPTGAA